MVPHIYTAEEVDNLPSEVHPCSSQVSSNNKERTHTHKKTHRPHLIILFIAAYRATPVFQHTEQIYVHYLCKPA